MTKIHGLTVCVDYAEEFAIGLRRWWLYLDSLTVITTAADTATIELVRTGLFGGVLRGNPPIGHLYVTDAFYRDGAAFNKGRALEEARRELVAREQWEWQTDPDAWVLLFDADVVPPADWHARCSGLAPGHLYGCRRFEGTPDRLEDTGQPSLSHDVPGVGYFQLFHSTDPAVLGFVDPLIDTCWRHAGNYDNKLLDRWRAVGRPAINLPFRLAHLGAPGCHWHGRGTGAAMVAMHAERKRRGGKWDHERIEAPQ